MNIEHKVKHYYQPTNNSCSQAALVTMLSFFGRNLTPESIIKKVPVNKDNEGNDWGTLNQQIATWCISQNFEVEIYSADFQVLDLSWADLPKDELLEKMEATKNARDIPSLGKDWSKIYMQSYIDFVNSGGKLHIRPYLSTELIDALLKSGPTMLCVCYNVFYNSGRSKNVGLRQSEPDDINGRLTNHSIVIYGKNKTGKYLVADPWKKPGLHEAAPEQLLAGMTASQMECDNLLIQLKDGAKE